MKKTLLILLFSLLAVGVCAAPEKEDIITPSDLKAAGEWNPFDKKEPPLSMDDAIVLAKEYLNKKFGGRNYDWVFVEDSPTTKLVLCSPNIWFWRLDFRETTSGPLAGVLGYRSVAILMNGRCLSPYFKIKTTEPNQSLQTTIMAVTDAAAQPPRQP